MVHLDVATHLEPHRPYLWAVLYRLTGCAADADDLVQETFLRALEKAPKDLTQTLRPWLVRVCVNLGKDHLRRRRRTRYVGTWLPSPIETDEPRGTDNEGLGSGPGTALVDASEEGSPPSYEVPAGSEISTEGRYDLVESVSYAFLVALECLTPQQRAVLLLRDVFTYSAKETAEVLDITQANVRTTLHRARRALADYENSRRKVSPHVSTKTRAVIDAFLRAIAAGDAAGIEALLANDAVSVSDSAGEFVAARNSIFGARNIAKFFAGLAARKLEGFDVEVRTINGLPACIVTSGSGPGERVAPRFVTRFDLNESGQVQTVHNILATAKLTAILP